MPAESQVARRLAESGCRVIVPTLIDRTVEPRNGRAKLTNREFLYRSAFELGRHIIGYEVQKVLALVDWLSKLADQTPRPGSASSATAKEARSRFTPPRSTPRIDAVCVSGYFDDRNAVWTQPIDRNVFGLLDQFGDAELASLVAPRPLIIEAAKGPEFVYPAAAREGPGQADDAEARDRQGRGRSRPQARRRAQAGSATSSWSSAATDGNGTFRQATRR